MYAYPPRRLRPFSAVPVFPPVRTGNSSGPTSWRDVPVGMLVVQVMPSLTRSKAAVLPLRTTFTAGLRGTGVPSTAFRTVRGRFCPPPMMVDITDTTCAGVTSTSP